MRFSFFTVSAALLGTAFLFQSVAAHPIGSAVSARENANELEMRTDAHEVLGIVGRDVVLNARTDSDGVDIFGRSDFTDLNARTRGSTPVSESKECDICRETVTQKASLCKSSNHKHDACLNCMQSFLDTMAEANRNEVCHMCRQPLTLPAVFKSCPP